MSDHGSDFAYVGLALRLYDARLGNHADLAALAASIRSLLGDYPIADEVDVEVFEHTPGPCLVCTHDHQEVPA